MTVNQTLEGELANIDFLESLYQQYQANPDQLPLSWQYYFKVLDQKNAENKEKNYSPVNPSLSLVAEGRILQLIEAYRRYGYLMASINPIALKTSQESDRLKWDQWGFEEADLSKLFPTFGLLPQKEAPLTSLIEALQILYSRSIGFEFKESANLTLESWLQHHIEQEFFKKRLSQKQKQFILESLTRSEFLETFLHTKYVGQKRFSLEGMETLIPMLALLLESTTEYEIEEIVLGMAHRGRLNVLTNIFNKSFQSVFREFDEHYIPPFDEGMGDVKYHKGFKGDYLTNKGKKIRLTLSPNPSHLESVDPVVEGLVRAKQQLTKDEKKNKIVPILIHGDAALSGQGVVYETLQMTHLAGYTTGGTLHFVINNQIGFTTLPRDLRSTRYCTDIAKTFGLPVFHVNAENPELCVQATLLALHIRQHYHCDVFIELNGYRKYGHNEGDEPAFTQPIEYQSIRKKKSIREIYREQLVEQGSIQQSEIEKWEEKFKQELQQAYSQAPQTEPMFVQQQEEKQISATAIFSYPSETSVSKERLIELAEHFSTIPSEFHLHPKLAHLVKERLKMVKESKPLDWGMAEQLAYATLLEEGTSIRLSGQDVCRGTFSHRHAMWMDQEKEEQAYYPLNHLKGGQGNFEAINSLLSEMAVLGFEYGYSVAFPQGLTIWEAQFGDFCNGAQVIIDHYIASGEQKWGQRSKLVLFLPHGYEGQGPEHSSARLERFLTLAGHDNIQIVNPTTPAQFFHLLRRQVHENKHEKPLIIFTPKGLLRHPACISRLDELVNGGFQEILDDACTQPQAVKQLVLCSGRIYYDLLAKRDKDQRQEIALMRIEQLYPLDSDHLKNLFARYAHIRMCQWVQEEPQNMGAWSFISPHLIKILPSDIPLFYVGREGSATPATGSYSRHEQEHNNLLHQVFET